MERIWMPGPRIPEFALVRIEHAVERSSEKNRAGLSKDFSEFGVQVGHEQAGISGIGSAALDERAQHCGDKGGADTMSHNVTNKDAGNGVGEADDVEKIAAYKAGRDIPVVKARFG